MQTYVYMFMYEYTILIDTTPEIDTFYKYMPKLYVHSWAQ